MPSPYSKSDSTTGSVPVPVPKGPYWMGICGDRSRCREPPVPPGTVLRPPSTASARLRQILEIGDQMAEDRDGRTPTEHNLTDLVDVSRMELLNRNRDRGLPEVLFSKGPPAGLGMRQEDGNNGDIKARHHGDGGGPTGEKADDWVESEQDDQLLLFVPFTYRLSLNHIQLTSVATDPAQAAAFLVTPPSDQDCRIVRPRTLKLFAGLAQAPTFDSIDEVKPTQEFDLSDPKVCVWSADTKTCRLDLRIGRFRNLTGLVVYADSKPLFDPDPDVDDLNSVDHRVRLDRIRLVGSMGQKIESKRLVSARN